MSRFLVTGASGFIGSHLTHALLYRGDEVVAVDAFTDYYDPAIKRDNIALLLGNPRLDLVEADLAVAPLGALVGGCDGVFHLAAQPGVRGSWGETFSIYLRDNVLATQRIFEAAVDARKRVVFASSSSVYGDAARYPTREDTRPAPVSPYGVTKHSCESLAGAYASSRGLDVVTLRYFTVYGPRQRPDMAFARIVHAALTGKAFRVFGSGEQSRDVTFVADAVDAAIAAMDRGITGRVYNVGGGSEISLREVLDIAGELAGRPIPLTYERKAVGDVKRTAADISLAKEELGWAPRFAALEGLAVQYGAARERADLDEPTRAS